MQTFAVRDVMLLRESRNPCPPESQRHAGPSPRHASSAHFVDLRPIVLAELGDELAIMGTDAFEPFEEIDVEIGAAEFAVRYPLQPCPLLTLDHLADAFVLDRPQFDRTQIAGGELFPRLQQTARPQEAPDMVGAKRRLRHGSSRRRPGDR